MGTKRKPISRNPIREGLEDETLVTLIIEGDTVVPPFTEFDYTPEQLIEFFLANEDALWAEAARRHVDDLWFVRRYDGWVLPGGRRFHPRRKGRT